MKSIITKIKEWYRGKYIPPPENALYLGHMEQPFLAKVIKLIGDFWLSHWKWVLPFLVGVAGLIVAVIRLSNG